MKIGFIDNIYFTPKGHSYLVQDLLKLLKGDGHEVHMYRIRDNPENPEFVMPDSIKFTKEIEVPEQDFRDWVKGKQLDWCIFVEYNQWWQVSYDKLRVCKELGVKTTGWLAYERLNWDKKDHYKLYNKIICSTDYQTKLFRKNGVFNAIYIPWGVDFKEIDCLEDPKRTDKTVFYHCIGSGGVGNRKNTRS